MDFSHFASLIGYAIVAYILFQCLGFVWSMFRCYGLTLIGFVKDLKKLGEWVIVTGATDGIGKEYARQFAKQGFKIVLISRTKEKLEQVSKEIEDEFHVETKFICFDFTKTVDYDKIEEVVKDLDVGILVNNVGMAVGERFSSFCGKDINDISNGLYCNIFSDIHMTHMVLRGMVDRKRGLVLHISSAVIYMELPIPIYPPTKVFMQKFSKSLNLENSGIDHQLVTPGYVATNLSRQKPGFTIPTSEEYVKCAIRTIGITDTTCGYLSHEFLRIIFSSMPRYVWTLVARRYAKKRDKLK